MKRILLSLLLAVVLSLISVIPVAAGSNVVVNEKDQATQVEEWVYDGWEGHYHITEVYHVNLHETIYADGNVKYTVNLVTNMSAYGDGIYGPYIEMSRHQVRLFNFNVGNDLVSHRIYTETREYESYFGKRQIILIYANGEVRVEIYRGGLPRN